MKNNEVEPLVETLIARPYEPATSLLARVAAKERAPHARQLSSDFYIRFDRVAAGDEAELKNAAKLLSADFDELARWSPRRSPTGFTLGGELITTYRSRRTRFRICPICAVEDVAAAPGLQLDAAVACRAFTLIEPIRTCFLHDTKLLQVADKHSRGEHHHDFSLAIADSLENWDDLVASPVSRAPTMFEWYLLGRVGFAQRIFVELADELEISDLTTLCQYIGLFVMRGRTAILDDLVEDELWEAERIGFGVLAEGEDGVRQFVGDAYDRAVADGERGMSSTIFDRFHYFLNSERSVGQFLRVKQIIIDRLSEVLPYGPGDTPLFGVVATKRYCHTLLSAEREYGIPYRTIQKLAQRAGLIEPLNTNVQKTRAVIAANELAKVLNGTGAHINRWNAAKLLGADYHHFAAFEEAGLLLEVNGGGKSKHGSTYRMADIDRIATGLLAHATPQDGEVDGMVSIRQAYVQSDWSLADVVGHVIDGTIRCTTIAGMKPVESIRVDLAGLRALHPWHDVPVLTMKQAATSLGVSEAVIGKLAATDRLESCRQRHPGRNGRRIVLSRWSVGEFRTRFIPSSELWGRGLSISKVAPFLAARDASPALPPDELRCSFYWRDQVEHLLSTG